jgi:hypothetical protein
MFHELMGKLAIQLSAKSFSLGKYNSDSDYGVRSSNMRWKLII